VGSQLARDLDALGYDVDVYEARQLSGFLRVRRNKTDAGDAFGIAEAGRMGTTLFSKVHIKSLDCQLIQSRLVIRRHLVRQRVRMVGLICRQVELYGGRISGTKTGAALRKKVLNETGRVFLKGRPSLVEELELLLDHAQKLERSELALHKELTSLAQENDLCRRLMAIPGVGPITALSFYACVGEPSRFPRTTQIGAYFGLTPKVHQSGLIERRGRISKMGNREIRGLLVNSAMSLMAWSPADMPLRKWAEGVEQRSGRRRARVALARKLATVMLAMWKSGEEFRGAPVAKSPSLDMPDSGPRPRSIMCDG